MPAPTVPYKILTSPEPRISDSESGPSVLCSALIKWADAFTFYNDVKGLSSRPVAFADLHSGFNAMRYPGDRRLFCNKCDITALGIGTATEEGANKGIIPGEYFELARADMQFSSFRFEGDPEDPDQAMQFDPENPVTFCTCDVDYKMELTQYEAGVLVWEDETSVAVPFKMSKRVALAELTLSFPKIPFLPFRTLQPFIDTVNKYPCLGCEPGTLLFNGASTKANFTSLGIKDKSCRLSFSWRKIPWWYRYKRSGALGIPVLKSDTSQRVVQSSDHRRIFMIPAY